MGTDRHLPRRLFQSARPEDSGGTQGTWTERRPSGRAVRGSAANYAEISFLPDLDLPRMTSGAPEF